MKTFVQRRRLQDLTRKIGEDDVEYVLGVLKFYEDKAGALDVIADILLGEDVGKDFNGFRFNNAQNLTYSKMLEEGLRPSLDQLAASLRSWCKMANQLCTKIRPDYA